MGGKMIWIEWNRPHRPWDKLEIFGGYMTAEGKVEKRICIIGNELSINQDPHSYNMTRQNAKIERKHTKMMPVRRVRIHRINYPIFNKAFTK